MTPKFHCFPLVMMVFISFWCQCFAYYPRMQNSAAFARPLNPNIRCPGKNEAVNIWRPCKHGGYIENDDPENCEDRYICYVGLDETCDPGDRCAYDATCTMCGICQKCESPEKCSQFRLCPNLKGFNLFKRTMQKHLFELDSE